MPIVASIRARSSAVCGPYGIGSALGDELLVGGGVEQAVDLRRVGEPRPGSSSPSPYGSLLTSSGLSASVVVRPPTTSPRDRREQVADRLDRLDDAERRVLRRARGRPSGSSTNTMSPSWSAAYCGDPDDAPRRPRRGPTRDPSCSAGRRGPSVGSSCARDRRGVAGHATVGRAGGSGRARVERQRDDLGGDRRSADLDVQHRTGFGIGRQRRRPSRSAVPSVGDMRARWSRRPVVASRRRRAPGSRDGRCRGSRTPRPTSRRRRRPRRRCSSAVAADEVAGLARASPPGRGRPRTGWSTRSSSLP